MDYEKIGQKIREYRKLHSFTQEELAEKIGISPTHMSHIETGSTKLSLPVLVDLSKVLQVTTDSIIQIENQNIKNKSNFEEFGEIYKKLPTEKQKALLEIARLM